jgi:predicted ATPase
LSHNVALTRFPNTHIQIKEKSKEIQKKCSRVSKGLLRFSCWIIIIIIYNNNLLLLLENAS